MILEPSHFELVKTFNIQFGVYIPDTKLPNILTEDPETIKFALTLIQEECKEFTKAYSEDDKIEQLDACIDTCYVTLGMFAQMGSNMDEFHFNNPMLRKVDIEDCDSYDQLLKKKLQSIEDMIRNLDYESVLKTLSAMYLTAMAIGKQLLKGYAEKKNINCHEAFNEVFNEIYDNNMTKFCKSEEEAIRTVKEKYGNHPEYKTPNYKKNEKGDLWIVYNENPSKVLKSISWKEVSLDRFVF